MNKLIIFMLATLALCTACSRQFSYVAEADKAMAPVIKKICKEEGIFVSGSGGAMMHEITAVMYAFETKREIDLPTARRICVRCVEELKDALNAVESIKPYLSPYPFPPSGIQASITFCGPDNWFRRYGPVALGQGGISTVFQVNNMIYYTSFNAETRRLEDLYEEPYEEALRLVLEGDDRPYDPSTHPAPPAPAPRMIPVTILM